MKDFVFLTGFMGSGKTFIGKKLAEKINKIFIDLDAEIEKKATKRIINIFQENGEDFFRRLEKLTLEDIVKSKNRAIVATGGGLIKNQENINLMKENGIVVYLEANTDTLFSRLAHEDSRPLLQVNDKKKVIENLYKERHPMYRKSADITIKVDGKSREKITDEIIGRLKKD